MPKVTGRQEVDTFFAQLPLDIETKLLRGAIRAGARVIAKEAKDRCTSDQVASAISIKSLSDEGRIAARVYVKGRWSNSRAIWLEYGTSPHFISVDSSQRAGRGTLSMNAEVKAAGGDGSLVIGGKFIGDTVFHPGARPHPFMRPALDLRERQAIDAAQGYINSRVTKEGIVGVAEPEEIAE